MITAVTGVTILKSSGFFETVSRVKGCISWTDGGLGSGLAHSVHLTVVLVD